MMEHQLRPKAPRFAQLITMLSFVLLYLPLIILVFYSFIAISPADGSRYLTLKWYRQIFSNEGIIHALNLSLWVGFLSTALSTFLGTAAAFALERKTFPGKATINAIAHVPLIMPEIVMGLSLLIWFVTLRITLGTVSIVLSHVTFCISYVMITVKTRLVDFDRSIEEAAQDLGATPWQTFWLVTFPLIRPGIISGALMAFIISFDDFLVTFFTSGVNSDTLPLKIYAMIKFGVSPEINALSTILLGLTLGGMIIAPKLTTGRRNILPP